MIETERLTLLPLTYEHLVSYYNNDGSLEILLNINRTIRTISEALKEALDETILPNVADVNKNYLFSTLWSVIVKKENKMIGDICFVGEPNENGEIEIGYGTYEEFRKKGYMTEAVGGMIVWAQKQNAISSITASTEKKNTASFLVLEKNHFKKVGETETLFHWRLKIN